MNINALAVTKTVVKTIVGVGAGKIVKQIIDNNTNAVSLVDKVTCTAGAFVIGNMIADATSSYTDSKIDEVVDAAKKISTAVSKS